MSRRRSPNTGTADIEAAKDTPTLVSLNDFIANAANSNS
jgi:hypothetical protein